MATTLVNAPITLEGSADDESGHRTYRVMFRVKSDDPKFDGPAVVMQTPGLPLPGSIYAFGNDLDVYAWCRPGMQVTRARGVHDRGPCRYYDVIRTFSTKPAATSGGTSSGRPGSSGGGRSGNRRGCHDGRVEDPLLEPQGISGSFIRRIDDSGHDSNGDPIVTSSWEPIPHEEEIHNPVVTVEQNVANLQLELCTGMLDTVNDDTLWGLPARVWKLTDFDWEQKFHGLCYPYYVRRFKFEANYRYIVNPFDGSVVLSPAWDKVYDDIGNKVLKGHWGSTNPALTGTATEGCGWVLDTISGCEGGTDVTPDPLNPGHFVRYLDRDGNATQVVLDGMGRPYDPADASRTFFWVYVSSDTPNASGEVTFADAFNLSFGGNSDGVARVYGPFYTSDQVTAAAADSDLFTSSRYRGWDSINAFPAPGKIKPRGATESNFLLLGIPIIL